MGKMATKLSLRHFPETNKTKSISLNCDWDGLVFIINSMFRSSKVIFDIVGRCVTGQRLSLNGTAHTLRTPIAGFWVKVYLRTDLYWMHEIDLFSSWSSTATSLGHAFHPGVLCGVCECRRKIRSCAATTDSVFLCLSDSDDRLINWPR